MLLSWALKGNDCITSLDISSNRIGPKGVAFLCDALQRNASLRALRIANNRVLADGASLVASLLHVNGTLCDVDLARNHLAVSEGGTTFDGITELCKAVYSNESVTSLNL